MISPKVQPASPEGELLSRINGVRSPSARLCVPGFTGRRPILSFILKTLAGDGRLLEKHLSFYLVWFEFGERGQNSEVDALDVALERHPSVLAHAIGGMVETMRRLTDLWIASGKSSADPDVDTPADRNVKDVLPDETWSLFEWIDGLLLARHPLYASLRRDGSMGIGDAPPRYLETHADRSTEARLQEYGAKFAAYWFVKLLDSKDARCIARCDHCKAYFAYERARLRTVKHGVSCPECNGNASVKRTRFSRAKRLGALVDTAAKAWLKRDQQLSLNDQKQWVADCVNEVHDTTVGRRWITQNWNEIQEHVEAQRNAKGKG